ncbi:MAG TPA: hypothetical protein VF463_00170 [Sphingobium sp.]
MGVSRAEQVMDKVSALDLQLTGRVLAALDTVSSNGGSFLYGLIQRKVRNHL